LIALVIFILERSVAEYEREKRKINDKNQRKSQEPFFKSIAHCVLQFSVARRVARR
jgi:hypothetical protein